MTDASTISGRRPAGLGPGRLILVVGPSGAGKDTLLGRARTAFADDSRIVFLRRVVTREASSSEDNDEMSPEEHQKINPLAYEAGDYVIVPKGTTHRLLPYAGKPSFFLIIETAAEIGIPDRGLLGQHALFDPAELKLPELKAAYDDSPGHWVVVVKRDDEYTRLTYPYHPIDVVGWRGTLTVPT